MFNFLKGWSSVDTNNCNPDVFKTGRVSAIPTPNKQTLVINLFGGPGAGKSTLAHGLCYELMKQHHKVEYVPEVAKDLIWESRDKTLQCQEYILAKQYRNLWRLESHQLDMIITDSPLLLSGCVYGNDSISLYDYAIKLFKRFKNLNFFIQSDRKNYSKVGRSHTLGQAQDLDKKIKKVLVDNFVDYSIIHLHENSVAQILNRIK